MVTSQTCVEQLCQLGIFWSLEALKPGCPSLTWVPERPVLLLRPGLCGAAPAFVVCLWGRPWPISGRWFLDVSPAHPAIFSRLCQPAACPRFYFIFIYFILFPRNIKDPSGGLCAGEVVARYGTDGGLRVHVRDTETDTHTACFHFFGDCRRAGRKRGKKRSEDAWSRGSRAAQDAFKVSREKKSNFFVCVLEVKWAGPRGAVTLGESLIRRVLHCGD